MQRGSNAHQARPDWKKEDPLSDVGSINTCAPGDDNCTGGLPFQVAGNCIVPTPFEGGSFGGGCIGGGGGGGRVGPLRNPAPGTRGQIRGSGRGTGGGSKGGTDPTALDITRPPKVSRAESPVWKKLEPYRSDIRRSGTGRDTQYYKWDHTHGDIEVFNHRGKHIGSMDPVTGKIYKPPVSGRTLE